MAQQLKFGKMCMMFSKPSIVQGQRMAIHNALPNGHLDLFHCFILGLLLQTSQSSLQGLLQQRITSAEANQDTVQCIKEKICENSSSQRCINLFPLNELNDNSLLQEIQQYLTSGSLSIEKRSPVQWSAVVFILLCLTSTVHLLCFKRRSP